MTTILLISVFYASGVVHQYALGDPFEDRRACLIEQDIQRAMFEGDPMMVIECVETAEL